MWKIIKVHQDNLDYFEKHKLTWKETILNAEKAWDYTLFEIEFNKE